MKNEEQLDLGVFFTVISKAFKRLGELIQMLFKGIGSLLLFLVLFVRNNIIWILIGTLIAFGMGTLNYRSKGPEYYSEMVVRANFGSTIMLYNQVSYFNSMISEGRIKELQSIFHLTPEEASKLFFFELKPLDEPLEVSRLYQEYLYKTKDTSWVNMAKFNNSEEFKKILTDTDYPLHIIKVHTRVPGVFVKIQRGIMESINNNEYFIKYRNNTVDITRKDEEILEKALIALDTLESNYNKRMLAGINSPNKESQYNFNMAAQQESSPELELYKARFEVKDALSSLKRGSIQNAEILQIYSELNPIGTKLSIFKQAPVTYTIYGFILSFILVIVIRIGIYVAKLKSIKDTSVAH